MICDTKIHWKWTQKKYLEVGIYADEVYQPKLRYIQIIQNEVQMTWGSLTIFQLRKILNLSHLLQMRIQLKKETEDSRKYFSKKATNEVKEFVRASNYQEISRKKNEILLYTGRIGSSPWQKRFCVLLVYTLTICLQYHQSNQLVVRSSKKCWGRISMEIFIANCLHHLWEGTGEIKLVCKRYQYIKKKTRYWHGASFTTQPWICYSAGIVYGMFGIKYL